jgi:hypothetical protein
MHVPASPRPLALAFALSALIMPAPAAAPPAPDLAAGARGVLGRHCLACHDQPGRAKGGLAHVADLRRLIERGQVVPGKPLASPLYRRVYDGEMPPKKRPPLPAAQRERLRAWIAAGAPVGAASSAPLAESAALALVRADLQALPAHLRRHFRYVTLGHLGGRAAAEQQTVRDALAKLVNSLSWHPRLTRPAAIDAGRLVYRLDLRAYRWTARQWDRLAVIYPYRQPEPDALAREAAALAGCDRPLLRADWFLATVSRPPFYHTFLQLPESDRALERMLQVDLAANIEEETAVRAGFNGSGVARGNRLLERHDALHGAYWRSYDFSDNTGKQNLFQYPLGPAPGPAGFHHAGGEIIFHLPNGLQGYLLVDADGRRIDRAPGEIVSDPARPDKVVENGLSCIGCHAQGIIPKDDQVRAATLRSAHAFTREQRDTILALYVPAARMQALIKEDNDRFAAALKRLGLPSGAAEPVSLAVQRYEDLLDLRTAAAEAGLTPEALTGILRRSEELARILGPLSARGVQRQVFEEVLPRLLAELPAGAEKGSARSASAGTFRGHEGAVRALAWAPDGKSFASAGDDGTIRVWDVAGGKSRILSSRAVEPAALAFSPDGRRLLAAGDDRVVTVLDVPSGRRLAQLVGHTAGVRAVAFTPDGRQAVSAGKDRTVRVWDLESSIQRRALAGPRGTITALAISPDGKHVVAGGADRTVRLWRLDDGKLLAWHDHPGEVHAVCFSPDGKRIFAGGADRGVSVHDIGGAGQARRLIGHPGTVTALAVAADGALLAACAHAESGERGLCRWDLATGRRQPFGPPGPVEAAALARDGRALLAAEGVIRLVRSAD